jgi:hypothetical protein
MTSLDQWAKHELRKAASKTIETAIEKLGSDVGAVFEPAVITALKAERDSAPADYQRHRKCIKDAGGSVVELDRLCATTGPESDPASGETVLFPEIEPWPEPVNGAQLLTDLAATYRRHVILPEHAPTALSLWTLFTHAIDFVDISPIMAISSPLHRCGKSTLLILLYRLTRRPLPAGNITAAAIFRSVEAWEPSLLIDEADSFLKKNEEMRGIINSGHQRELAYVIRTVGDDHEPRRFSTWSAKAIALIGKLPITIADRSIEVPLKRKLPGDKVKKLRHADPDLFRSLAQKCARFAADNGEKIRASRPSMPDGLHDRAEDNWEPLLSIADLAGGEWPKQARRAARALSGGVDPGDDALGVQLLSDIRTVLKGFKGIDRISSEVLTTRLLALDDGLWGEVSKGKPLTKTKLSRMLRPFQVLSGSRRLPDGTTPKSFYLEDLADAFERYLPPSEDTLSPGDPPFQAQHRHKQDGTRVSEDFAIATSGERVVSENGRKPSCGAGCGNVADKNPSLREKRDEHVATDGGEGGPRLPHALDGYATPPGDPPLAGTAMARQMADMAGEGEAVEGELVGPEDLADDGGAFIDRSLETGSDRAWMRWVTHEILPTIRRTGSYKGQVPDWLGPPPAWLSEFTGDTPTCPRCAGQGCAHCGDTGRIIDDEPEEPEP